MQNEECRMMNDEEKEEKPGRAPLQFSIRALLGMAVAVAVLFGMLRWFEVSPQVSAIILIIIVVAVAAALGLVVAIAAAGDNEE